MIHSTTLPIRSLPALAIALTVLTSSASANLVRVDRSNGQVTWTNTSDEPIYMLGYVLHSQSGSLQPDAWRSITESQYTTGHTTVFGTWQQWYSPQPMWLAETTPLAGLAILWPDDTIDFGTGLWRGGDTEDLQFGYFDAASFVPDLEEFLPTSVPVEYFGQRGGDLTWST